MRRALVCGVGLVLCSWCGSAAANGRFPRAERLKELSPDRLLLSGTYGLVVTGNGGKDWHFICESLLFGQSANGSYIDPLLELLGDETVVSGSPHALRVSRDFGCSFETDMTLPVDPAFFGGGNVNDVGKVIDLTTVPAKGPQSVVALATLHDAQGQALEHRLYESNDSARTWQPLGVTIPVATANPVFTIDVAPSDPTRIYVSGSAGGSFVLLRSSDSGESFAPFPISVADESSASGAYIAAVSASVADQLYLRVPRWTEDVDGTQVWDDSLLFSQNGGETFTDVLRKQANLLGFALSPDGGTVLAGYGDPSVAPIYTDTTMLGLYRASVSDHVFAQLLPTTAVSCVTWTSNALYVCAKEKDPLGVNQEIDFHLGRSSVPAPGAIEDFTTLLKLKDVRGPAPWSDGRENQCDTEWLEGDPGDPQASSVCQSMNACEAGQVALSPGATLCSPSPGAGGMAGAGGSAGQAAGGSAGSGGQISSGGNSGSQAGGAPGGANGGEDSSCACRAGSPQSGCAALLLGLLGLGVLGRRRARGHRSKLSS